MSPSLPKNTVRTITENYKKDHDNVVDFGVLDSRGRLIGAHIYFFEIDFIKVPEDWKHVYYVHMLPGHYLGARMQATRDGKSFGSSQNDSYFHTEEERNAAVAKYLLNAHARAHRKSKS